MKITYCVACGFPYNDEITGGHICPGPTASTAGRFADLVIRLAFLEAENAKLRKDAKRWKWARSNPQLWPVIGRQMIADEYADAAMENQNANKTRL